MQTNEPNEKDSSPDNAESSKQTLKAGQTFLAPMPGFRWNPLLTLPPNRTCPCLSGLKFKRCCRDTLPKAVPEKVAKQFEEQMAKPDLVFVTKANQAFLKEKAEALGKALPRDPMAAPKLKVVDVEEKTDANESSQPQPT